MAVDDGPRHPGCMTLLRRRTGTHTPRPAPSILLWRWRHLVVGLCVGAAALMTLSLLSPDAGELAEVLVTAHQVTAGEVIQESDLSRAWLPTTALPQAGLADDDVVGSRAAVTLEKGTVLTSSMTSLTLTSELTTDERVVQVPVEVGSELAQPGAVVDVVAEVAPQTLATLVEGDHGVSHSLAEEEDAGQSAPGASLDAEQASTTTGMSATTPVPTVICAGARVLLTQREDTGSRWTGGTMVTLVTLVVPASTASLVVGAATHGALGLVFSP